MTPKHPWRWLEDQSRQMLIWLHGNGTWVEIDRKTWNSVRQDAAWGCEAAGCDAGPIDAYALAEYDKMLKAMLKAFDEAGRGRGRGRCVMRVKRHEEALSKGYTYDVWLESDQEREKVDTDLLLHFDAEPPKIEPYLPPGTVFWHTGEDGLCKYEVLTAPESNNPDDSNIEIQWVRWSLISLMNETDYHQFGGEWTQWWFDAAAVRELYKERVNSPTAARPVVDGTLHLGGKPVGTVTEFSFNGVTTKPKFGKSAVTFDEEDVIYAIYETEDEDDPWLDEWDLLPDA